MIFITIWILLPNVHGFILFQFLLTTRQIEYEGILTNPDLPLGYAIAFQFTDTSLLHYPNPIAGFTNPPVHAFSAGNFVAINHHKAPDHSEGALPRHELRHAWQNTIYGPLNYIAYGGWKKMGQLQGKSYWEIYLSNPFERDAFAFSRDQNRYNDLIDRHVPHLQHLKMSTQR